jgi:hypothetical protein
MPEHIRALVVVLALSAALFFIARPALIQVVPAQTFDRWRKLWYINTLAWFLCGNIWIYMAFMVLLLTKVRRQDPQILGLYLLLLFAAPSAYVAVPAFGVMDHLIMLDHYRLLALVLLLPTALRLRNETDTVKVGGTPVDYMVLGYLFLTWSLSAPETTVTNALRMVVLTVIDAWLPYYVASRSIRSLVQFRFAMCGLLIGALMLSVLAAFEVIWSWKLYRASVEEYGLFVGHSYKARGGFVRPGASVQDSIVLGTVVVMGMCVLLYFNGLIDGLLRSGRLWAVLVLGLVASLSRAPWVASLMIFVVFYSLEGKTFGILARGAVFLSIAALVLSFFPLGQAIFDLLPYMGNAEQGNIEYRENWFAVSQPLIERNFWFGDVNAIKAPELEVMRQGEGIIDLVNTFLAVLLFYGAVGLCLFFGVFVLSLRVVQRSERIFRRSSKELSALGRAILAAVASLMFIISTLSTISVIPILIWALAGLSAAYGLIKVSEQSQTVSSNAALS